MNQRDEELLEKQLRAINLTPRYDGVIIVTLLVGFLAGMRFLAVSSLVTQASRCT